MMKFDTGNLHLMTFSTYEIRKNRLKVSLTFYGRRWNYIYARTI